MNLSVNKKINEPCPHCLKKGIDAVGKYQKGWTMKKRQQKKGAEHGQTIETGTVEISLYKCQNCRRLFRKGRFLPKVNKDGDNSN